MSQLSFNKMWHLHSSIKPIWYWKQILCLPSEVTSEQNCDAEMNKNIGYDIDTNITNAFVGMEAVLGVLQENYFRNVSREFSPRNPSFRRIGFRFHLG